MSREMALPASPPKSAPPTMPTPLPCVRTPPSTPPSTPPAIVLPVWSWPLQESASAPVAPVVRPKPSTRMAVAYFMSISLGQFCKEIRGSIAGWQKRMAPVSHRGHEENIANSQSNRQLPVPDSRHEVPERVKLCPPRQLVSVKSRQT